MKLFNQEKDIVYTFDYIKEGISSHEAASYNGALGATDYYPDTIENIQTPSNRIKTYNHWTSGSLSGGYYYTLYDRPYTDKNAVAFFDFTVGSSVSSSFNGTASVGSVFVKQKNRIYSSFANLLLGNPRSIFEFGGSQRHDLCFICFKRNQFKDEIDKSPNISYLNSLIQSGNIRSVYDADIAFMNIGENSRRKTTTGTRSDLLTVNSLVSSELKTIGQIFHEQGVVVYDILEMGTGSAPGNEWLISGSERGTFLQVYKTTEAYMNLDKCFDGVRHRIINYRFINSIKVRRSFYTCTAERDEFNYSSNPSFIKDSGEIITASGSVFGKPVTYITRVALLGPNQEVLAQATLKKPVRKDFDRKVTIKVRLDY